MINDYLTDTLMSINTIISDQIPQEPGDLLTKVALTEERSQSYYVKEGLEQFFHKRLDNLPDDNPPEDNPPDDNAQDYEDARQAYEAFIASGEPAIPLDEVFKGIP